MQKMLILLLMMILWTGCSTSYYTEDGRKLTIEEKRAYIAQQIHDMLLERHFCVNVDMATPQRGRSMHLSSNFSLEIRGDSIISYLPFFGRAYRIPYGGGKGLNFVAYYDDYAVAHPKADLTTIYVVVDTREDMFHYRIDVYDNGKVNIDVDARERDRMSYSGQMDLWYKRR